MKSLFDSSDEELRQIADGGPSVDRLSEVTKRGGLGIGSSTEAETLLRQLKALRDEGRAGRAELENAGLLIQNLQGQLDRAKAELAEKTAALRLTDPETVARRVEEARAAGRADAAANSEAELVKLRSEVSRQRSEIDDLRASKKKLREALDRLKEGR